MLARKIPTARGLRLGDDFLVLAVHIALTTIMRRQVAAFDGAHPIGASVVVALGIPA